MEESGWMLRGGKPVVGSFLGELASLRPPPCHVDGDEAEVPARCRNSIIIFTYYNFFRSFSCGCGGVFQTPALLPPPTAGVACS